MNSDQPAEGQVMMYLISARQPADCIDKTNVSFYDDIPLDSAEKIT